jgi:putative endonuclease
MKLKNKRKKGDIYEKIAIEFLVKHGFSIIYNNYYRSFGEIDIIAEKDNNIHFIEVKSVSYETLKKGIKPEDHVTREKVKKITQTAQHFLAEHELFDVKCQIDLVTILSCSQGERLVDINYFENIH